MQVRTATLALCSLCLLSTSACLQMRAMRPSTAKPGSRQVVYLKDASVVSGTVVERVQGRIVIVLDDNTMRRLESQDIEYMGQPRTGGAHISAPARGHALLDGQLVGLTPVDLTDIPAGTHRVSVYFDSGQHSTADLVVHTGRVTVLTLPLPSLLVAARYRDGVRFVLGGGPEVGLAFFMNRPSKPELTARDSLLCVGLGLGMQAGINIGLSPRSDLRLLGHIGVGEDTENHLLWYELAASLALRLNLGGWYSLELGGRAGLSPEPARGYTAEAGRIDNAPGPFFGVQLSPLSLRLGQERRLELTLWNAFDFYLYRGGASVRVGISVAQLFQ